MAEDTFHCGHGSHRMPISERTRVPGRNAPVCRSCAQRIEAGRRQVRQLQFGRAGGAR